MTKKEIIQVLMSNPHYLKLGLRERKEVFDYLYVSYQQNVIGKRKVRRVSNSTPEGEVKINGRVIPQSS